LPDKDKVFAVDAVKRRRCKQFDVIDFLPPSPVIPASVNAFRIRHEVGQCFKVGEGNVLPVIIDEKKPVAAHQTSPVTGPWPFTSTETLVADR
jgi:hypothetical protein